MFVDNRSDVAPLRIDDVLVFIGLESLGTLAIVGNVCLIVVLLRNKYLQRASFVLMLSLAFADVVHGIVTTSFFYPPIILKVNPMPPNGVRIFNIFDWTAWSITLTHMSAICLDRLVAIMLYGRYAMLVTVRRMRFLTIFCWTTFFSINTIYILMRVCCLIAPLRNNQFYTFGYGEFETDKDIEESPFGSMNMFTFTYSPLELTTLAILSISNPITLVQLYRRHKRKIALRIQNRPRAHAGNQKARSQWQRASTMLLEMSMRMGSKHLNNDVRELASRRANRQQQRILLQISVVAVIFYLYMTTYYLVYHILEVQNKWVVLFNSFFYSTTHMINPVIYFSLNKEMRAQLFKAISDVLAAICCIRLKSVDSDGVTKKPSTEQRSSTKGVENSMTITETSPLFSASHHNNHIRTVERIRTVELSASLRRLAHNNTPVPTPPLTETLLMNTLKVPNGNHNTAAGGGTAGEEEQNIDTDHLLKTESPIANGELKRLQKRNSLLKTLVKAMRRVAARDESLPPSQSTSHSRSLDFIESHSRCSIPFSHTVFGLSDSSGNFERRNRSYSIAEVKLEESGSSDRLVRESLVMLLNETTVAAVDDERPDQTPDDEIIFL